MSWTEGLVECSPLSAQCFVDWGAVTTGLAVVVALGVGVFPIIRDSWRRERIAKTVAKISAGELALIEHRLGVAAELILRSNDLLNHWLHKEVKKLTAQVSGAAANALIPHIESIPLKVEDCLVECAGLLSAFERSVTHVDKTRPSECIRMKEERMYYLQLASRVANLRKEICEWANAKFEDLTEPVAVGVDEAIVRASDEEIRFRLHNPPSRDAEVEPS